jgi:hypothetical protein
MAQCVTCGTELHPERALKYDYCMAPECQEKNAKGLTMVAVGMNKAADEFMILDERTREELASGKYRDQRRGLFGPAAPAAGPRPAPAAGPRPAAKAGSSAAQKVGSSTEPNAAGPARRAPRRAQSRARAATPARAAARQPWTRSQEKLALLYNEQGLRPDEIAAKIGVSAHMATQIILAAKNRGKA